MKYLEHTLDQIDGDWAVICWNIKRSRKGWGRPVKMLWREGTDTQVSDILYRSVVQAMLIFGSDSWLLSSAMEGAVEGTRIWFLQKIRLKWACINTDSKWVTPEAEVVLYQWCKHIYCNNNSLQYL